MNFNFPLSPVQQQNYSPSPQLWEAFNNLGKFGVSVPNVPPVVTPTFTSLSPNGLNIPEMLSGVQNAGMADVLQAPMSSAATSDLTNQGWMARFNAALQNSGALGSTNMSTGVRTDGWGAPAINLLGGLTNLFMGMKQYGLAKQVAADSRSQFERNFNAQRQTINTRMEDRQRARVSADPNAESVDSYMKRNRV